MDRKTIFGRFVTAMVLVAMSLAGGSALAGGFLDVPFEDGNFPLPRDINNDYWPLAPGGTATTFIYLGETEDGCVFDKVESNPVISKVLAVPYDVVTPMVVVDREWETEMDCDEILDELADDEEWEPSAALLGEVTHDWYAQDKDQNIWYMGELSRSFDPEEGCDTGDFDPFEPTNTDDECYAGSWEAGVKAGEEGEEVTGRPGIVVPSDTPFGSEGEPLSNGTYYFQEVAYEAEDMAKVLRMSAPLDDYANCRKVKEWNPYEPGESVEHKWYCADGPGLVLIEGIGGGPTEIEELVLVFTP